MDRFKVKWTDYLPYPIGDTEGTIFFPVKIEH